MNWFITVVFFFNWLGNAHFCVADLYNNGDGLDRSSQWIFREDVMLKFYDAAHTADRSKELLQNQLRHFLENLQKNLSTSPVLNGFRNDPAIVVDGPKLDVNSSTNYLQRITKLKELSIFFHIASDSAGTFARHSEQFFDTAKNLSYILLLKLRQVPSTQPTPVKIMLTNYFEEMEYFHIIFSEIMDEALEYTQSILHTIQKTFIHYAEIQRSVLDWKLKIDVVCCNRYMEFSQNYSSQIFKCAAGNDLNTAADIFSITILNAKYIMRQLEFRIQQIFNCFVFGKYKIRCRFLYNAERDFQQLFMKLEELESYYAIRKKSGRTLARVRRMGQFQETPRAINVQNSEKLLKCIPPNFPVAQMPSSLRSCFYFIGHD
ncbi:uncharacterized protein LOC115621544 [Scaptodrosophila lebanonensis]|uniref:Uncharacterized protein LOC115621544 n=1 Tax=Drosophila lebanonensis TaxID=7225 RepID=A0A6J2T4W9_DROLE|nr:uncharacterized protein LOC115621544 [Scaptodrosophila lebanonensis]